MSYADLLRHHTMVLDEVRNAAYLKAMAEVITPESVVLDLGAGVGVLGLLAAKLGARKVYCVEPSPVAAHIPALAQANGVADRVVALRGRIEDIELPEQVDVILSVFTGNLLFTEGLLPSLYFARDRWLKPGGAMIPDAARLLFAGVEAPARYAETAGRYRRESLGIDYSALAANVANSSFLVARGKDAPVAITPVAIAAEIDLRTTFEDGVHFQVELDGVRDGVLHGMLGWIEIRLGEDWLSSGLDGAEIHWQPTLLPIASPLEVKRGQPVALSFRFVDDMSQFWSVTVDGVQRRQSTVLGSADAAIDVMLSSAACGNPLGSEGRLVERALAAMREGRSNRAIADELREAMPRRFRDERDALRWVGALAARYRTHPARKA